MRIRVKYSIQGRIRFISHLDLMRAFFRACIKRDIPVQITQGFSPHLKISFGPPLNLGMTSSCEYLDIFMEKPVDPVWIKTELQEGLPEGIKIEEVAEVSLEIPSLSSSINRAVYTVSIPGERICDLDERIKKCSIKKLEFNGEKLYMDVPIGQGGIVRPIEVLRNLWPEIEMDELKLWHINREELYPAPSPKKL